MTPQEAHLTALTQIGIDLKLLSQPLTKAEHARFVEDARSQLAPLLEVALLEMTLSHDAADH